MWQKLLPILIQAAAGLISDGIKAARERGETVDVPAVLAQLAAQITARAGQVSATEAGVANILDDRHG